MVIRTPYVTDPIATDTERRITIYGKRICQKERQKVVLPLLRGRRERESGAEGIRRNRDGAFLVAQLVKNLPAMWEAWVRSLGWEDPLEKGKATHSSILAWRIPWTV